MTDLINVKQANSFVKIVTFNRPDKLNALSQEMIDELISIAENAIDADSRVIILTGSGRAFSAGGDITRLLNLNPEQMSDYLNSYANLLRAISKSEAVWIAALNGLAFGGGLEIATMCDLVIAEKNSKMCVADIEVGALPTGGLTWRLPRIAGQLAASWLTLTNAVIDADRAFELNLVNEVVQDGDLLSRGLEVASQIAQFDHTAVLANRKATRQSWNISLQQAIDFEVSESVKLLQKDEIFFSLKKRFTK